MNKMISDLELISLIAEKDTHALEQLYNRYEHPMYCFAYQIVKDRMIAEEVIQELFMKIWNNPHQYRSDHGKLSSWMFSVTRNASIDHLRKKQHRIHHALTENEDMLKISDTIQNTETEAENNWTRQQIRTALKELNPDQREVLETIYYEGLTQQEAAEHMNIALGTVKSRVRLAMKHLKEKLGHLGRRSHT